MGGKPKFRPRITRVKLNPEQAVLSCSCWSGGHERAQHIWEGPKGWGTWWSGCGYAPSTVCVGKAESGTMAPWPGPGIGWSVYSSLASS